MEERLPLSSIQIVFKFFIEFVFQVFEHPCSGVHNPPVNHRYLVVVSLPASLTDKVLNINPVPVRKNGFTADGTFPFHQSRCLVINPPFHHMVEGRVIDQVQVLFLNPVKIT